MLIENPDAFKSWLTSILEPLCDADPAALAKYVYALVKKDKQLDELREGMLDQLDVFLQQETKPFVDMLFKSLETNEYLKLAEKAPESPGAAPAQPPEPPAEPQLPPPPLPPVPVENHASNGVVPPPEPRPPLRAKSPAPPRQRVVVRPAAKPAVRPPHEQTLVKVLPLNELLDEPIDQPPRRRDRRNDSLRDKEDRGLRRRRSRSWERRARNRRHRDNHADVERRRAASRSPSPRGRYRNRSPPPPPIADRLGSRSRSRSPGPIRERDHDRERERLRVPREIERDRMSRDRERERMSRDRDRMSRDRDRSRERSRSGSRGGSVPPAYRRRCRDYDEKGFCLRGDLCQWDHGSDPVVLEDSTLSRVVDVTPAPPEYNPLTPDIWCGAGFPPYPPPHLPRELVPIPRIRQVAPPPLPMVPRPPLHNNHHNKPFDYNRLNKGPRPPFPQHASNCSLQVKKVPRGLNDITHLNTHFSKFGKIVNIQVCFENDPEAALITFSTPTEANVAYKSTEAVLNNRFIKVFWYNPENKQENQAPPTQANKMQTNDKQKTNPYASQNRVLINSNNMKLTNANNNEKKEQPDKPPSPSPTDPPTAVTTPPAPQKDSKQHSKQVVDMYRRARGLLDTQLRQQVLLIQRLETGNDSGPQKAALMEAINSAQEGIEKLRKELVAYTKMLKQMELTRSLSRLQLQGAPKKPKTREEAQKEILDAELDMFTKQQEGQDVTELARKIAELRRAMSVNFPSHQGGPPHSRGRFNPLTRFVRGQNKAPPLGVSVNQSVDHRPKALLVSGFEADELDSLTTHLAQFGEIISKDMNLSVPELIVQYKARAMAEQALLRGKHYNDRTLSITWALSPKLSGGAGAASNGDKNDDNKEQSESQQEAAEDPLMRFDEEEEDDTEEDRSWRR